MHLQYLEKPTLIIQGDRDEYGGFEGYTFSSTVETVYIHTGHDIDLDAKGLSHVVNLIHSFVLK